MDDSDMRNMPRPSIQFSRFNELVLKEQKSKIDKLEKVLRDLIHPCPHPALGEPCGFCRTCAQNQTIREALIQ